MILLLDTAGSRQAKGIVARAAEAAAARRVPPSEIARHPLRLLVFVRRQLTIDLGKRWPCRCEYRLHTWILLMQHHLRHAGDDGPPASREALQEKPSVADGICPD
jgi:hypothetical protein